MPPAPRINPAAVIDTETAEQKMEETLEFLHGLELREGMGGVHAPGEGLAATRARHLAGGIPVTEATWEKICRLAQA